MANSTNQEKKTVAGCDSCYHYVEDEETGELYCEIDLCLDEDEYRTFCSAPGRQCPYYQFNDEYISVRKQI